MIRFLILLLILPAMAVAQGFPALYSVTGVASDDTLNVRSGPGTNFEIVGELPHDATYVEVVTRDEVANWGLVNVGERSGWVSLAFMQRQVGDWAAQPTYIDSCFGTEPFWSLSDLNGEMRLTNLGEPVFYGAADGFALSPGLGRLGLIAHGDAGVLALFVEQDICTDGMSDRSYGLSARIVTELEGGGTQLWAGCCTLQP